MPRPLPSNPSHSDTAALFLYRQRFRFPGDSSESTRIGIMGLLGPGSPRILLHEETIPARVDAIRRSLSERSYDPGPLWLWCNDPDGCLASVLEPEDPPHRSTTDSLGCIHEYWEIDCPGRIANVQRALTGKQLFLADGHHRYAAGWDLAVIQIRNSALQSLASHRLFADSISLEDIAEPRSIPDIENYLATTPEDRRRFVLYATGSPALGFEVEDSAVSVAKWLKGGVTAIRGSQRAIDAVRRNCAACALLLSPPLVKRIEQDAASGILLPPKSTDFFPKLAAGLVIHRDQKENVSPPMAQRLGVRNPSS